MKSLFQNIKRPVRSIQNQVQRTWRDVLVLVLTAAMLLPSPQLLFATGGGTSDPTGEVNASQSACSCQTGNDLSLMDPNIDPMATSDDPIILRTGEVYERYIGGTIPTPASGTRRGIPVNLKPPQAKKRHVHVRAQKGGSSKGDRGLRGGNYKTAPTVYENTYTSGLVGPTGVGNKWVNNKTGTYLEQDGSDIVLKTNAVSKVKFEDEPGNTFISPASTTLTLEHNPTDDVYILTDKQRNLRVTFYDFTVNPAYRRGKVKETTTVQYNSRGKAGDEYTYNSLGQLIQITTAEPQSYTITFSQGRGVNNIEFSATVDTPGGGTASVVFQKIEYTYYSSADHSSDVGNTDDLVQVKTSQIDSNGALSITKYIQYRYHNDSRLKAVYEDASIRRMVDSMNGITDPEDLLGEADSFTGGTGHDLTEYADRSFEYYIGSSANTASITTPFATNENLEKLYGGINVDENNMVHTETIGGCSSCSGTVAVKKTYSYMDLNVSSTDADTVRRLVVEDTEDANGDPVYRTIYGVNDTGQLLRKAVITDPLGAKKIWCESNLYATTGKAHRLTEYRTPAAHNVTSNLDIQKFLDPSTGTNDADTLNSSEGAIYKYTYNSDGLETSQQVKKGSGGTFYYESATDYSANQAPIATYTYPTKTTSRTGGAKTTYVHTYWDVENQEIKKTVTTIPAVSTGENGSGVAIVFEDYYDDLGRHVWSKDGEGYCTYYAYHGDTANMAYVVVDIDPSSVSTEVSGGLAGKWLSYAATQADVNKPTRGAGLPTPLELTAKAEYDLLGRTTKIEGPNGAEHYISYGNTQSIVFPNWNSTTSETDTPIRVIERNTSKQLTDVYSVKAGYSAITVADTNADADTDVAPIAFSTAPSQTDYLSWSKRSYDDFNGRITHVDTYHKIPDSGDGTLSDNYYRTIAQYNDMGQIDHLIQVINGSSAGDRTEQVVQYLYDDLFRIKEVKTDVSSTSHNMTDDYNTYPTLQTMEKVEYDDGGVGNGFTTKVKRYYGTGTDDYTGANLKWTYRGDIRGVEPFYMSGSTETAVGPFPVRDINWSGNTTFSSVYDSVPDWSTVLTGDGYTDYANLTYTDRIAKSRILYDTLGRPYRTLFFRVEPNGSTSKFFANQFYRNRNGQLVGYNLSRTQYGEIAYDGAGRAYQTREVHTLEPTLYATGEFQYRDPVPNPTLASMTGGDDQVRNMVHRVFDGSLMTEVHAFENIHSDVNSGTKGIDLTNNDDYVRTSAFGWYDDLNRLTTIADYGSGDTDAGTGVWKYTTIPVRPSTAPSVSSDTKLVNKLSYNSETGRVETVTDALGNVSKAIFDDLGRTLYSIENYIDFDESNETGTGHSTDKSMDRVTKYIYGGAGQLDSVTALDANGDGSLSDNQVTQFLYEDAIDTSRQTQVIFPDSSDTTSGGSDQLKYVFNIDGSLDQFTNQVGTVFDLTYNDRRQTELVDVTTLGTGIDGHVRSVKRTYDDQGRLEKVTSYANTGGTGTVRNEVQVALNNFDQITNLYQSHEGAVNTGSSLQVEYEYDEAVGGSVMEREHRLKNVTYPDGRVIHYDFDTGTNNSGFFNRASLPRNIREDNETGNILSQYTYNGSGSTVFSNLLEPNVKLSFLDNLTNDYRGYDRFGRVKEQLWDGYSGTADVDEFDYVHDYNGNVSSRDIPTGINASNNKDQTFIYDDLNRMLNFDEGTLASGSISGTPAKEQDLTLDAIGNWTNQEIKTSGTTNLNQTRTVNDANEITNITESTGPAWITPAYNAAGNMTTIPKPADPTGSYTATYDAFGRMVKLVDGANTVAEYEYDGLGQRIVKSVYASGVLDHRQHVYYNSNWQALEVRKEVGGTEDHQPLEQYVWHPQYIDAPVLRDYDADTDGTAERHYYSYDANYNITAVTDGTGTVLERYHYSPFGELEVLDADFSADADGKSDIENSVTYTGRRFDEESGLYYFRHRYHHPQLGHFTNRDPAGYVDGMSLYQSYFAPGGVDPFGLWGLDKWFWNYWTGGEASPRIDHGSYEELTYMQGNRGRGNFYYWDSSTQREWVIKFSQGNGKRGLLDRDSAQALMERAIAKDLFKKIGQAQAQFPEMMMRNAPISGDLIAIADAVEDPCAQNIASAMLVPIAIGIGGSGKKFAKNTDHMCAGGAGGAKKRKISLGIEDFLDKFSKKHDADSWKVWAKADPENWKSKFKELMNNPESEVLFNLDGIDDAWSGAARGASVQSRATDWELSQIYSHPNWWPRIKWIKDGKQVSNPFGD